MRRQADREQDIRQVMTMIERAANSGRPCPSNPEIASALGMQSRSGPVTIIAELEKRGRIRVDRFNSSRRVTVLASGKATAVNGQTIPHWRDTAPPKPKVEREPRYIGAPPELTRVDSRACFNCGAAYARCACHGEWA